MAKRKTTSEFIRQATAVHGNTYDYEAVKYTNAKSKLKIRCRKHGVFEQLPNNHLNGAGCPRCGWEQTKEKLVSSKEKFIKKARKIHGGRYQYPGDYTGCQAKLEIVCPKHGSFIQEANSHLQGSGCPECGAARVSKALRATKEEFIRKATAVHGSRYSYDLVRYKGAHEKIEIRCREHGSFWQTASSHLTGRGCPLCGNNARSKNSRLTSGEFLQRAKQKHGTKYVYLDEYETTFKPVKILCPEHGVFTQTPNDHLAGRGCKKCGYLRMADRHRKTTEEFIRQAQSIHTNKEYDYSLVSYSGAQEKVEILCAEHGPFLQYATDHLQGKGCPACAQVVRSEALRLSHEQFLEKARAIHGDKYTYPEQYELGGQKLNILCPRHGLFPQTPRSHICGAGCPKCANCYSAPQAELAQFLKQYFPDLKENYRYNREKTQREFDVYIPAHNFAVEFDGLWWHCTKHKNKQAQLQTTLDAHSLGITLVRIFEDEWYDRRPQVESLLLSRLGKRASERIYARQCIFVYPNSKQAKDFYNQYHIQGFNGRSKHHIGLSHNDKLVACMTFTKAFSNRRQTAKPGTTELQRFATSGSIPGAASKLFKHYVRDNNITTCTSYSDNRLFGGGVYQALGFANDGQLPPDYQYVFFDPIRREHKAKWQKSEIAKKLPHVYNEAKTEEQMMEEAGIFRVYNDGLTRWVWRA